nr:hypothetical protein CFP56_74721 [Quercus suber]
MQMADFKLTVEINYGGKFVWNPNLEYIGGNIAYEDVNPDCLSFFEIQGLCEKYGAPRTSTYHYLIPGSGEQPLAVEVPGQNVDGMEGEVVEGGNVKYEDNGDVSDVDEEVNVDGLEGPNFNDDVVATFPQTEGNGVWETATPQRSNATAIKAPQRSNATLLKPHRGVMQQPRSGVAGVASVVGASVVTGVARQIDGGGTTMGTRGKGNISSATKSKAVGGKGKTSRPSKFQLHSQPPHSVSHRRRHHLTAHTVIRPPSHSLLSTAAQALCLIKSLKSEACGLIPVLRKG